MLLFKSEKIILLSEDNLIRMITRAIESAIKECLFQKKALLLFGARQVGKTTMITKIINDLNISTIFLNGDEADIKEMLSNTTSVKLKSLIGDNRLLVIDEAQMIPGIGTTIKILVDTVRNVQVIATGSSSFELANRLNEPLTGRKFEFTLFPVSFGEMVRHHGLIDEKRYLDQRLLYGYYPEIVTASINHEKLIRLLAGSYLYKDLLMLESIKKPALIEKLLRALALQIGSEVSFSELSQLIGADKNTIEKYIDLLEKVYVIFRLPAFHRNVRNEIRKGRKIYFYDNGIRNAVLNNFTSLQSRSDAGALWENFIISERIKYLANNDQKADSFFWRTVQQQEIDYIEDQGGNLSAYEIKWSERKRTRFSSTFTTAYPDCKTYFINPSNYHEFLI